MNMVATMTKHIISPVITMAVILLSFTFLIIILTRFLFNLLTFSIAVL